MVFIVNVLTLLSFQLSSSLYAAIVTISCVLIVYAKKKILNPVMLFVCYDNKMSLVIFRKYLFSNVL